MSPTFADLMKARVPVAICVYYWRVKSQRNAWHKVREWIHREFRGIDPKVVEQLIVISKAGIRQARQLNRKAG